MDMEYLDRPAFYDSDIDGSERSVEEIEGPFMDKFVIAHNNKNKSRFDSIVLFCVAYSCITSLYNSAFTPLPAISYGIFVFDWVVEAFFYADLLMGFFQAYFDRE